MNTAINIECTYFDISKVCSISGCTRRPIMRKTGKCAPHSVIPFDEEREDDWIDCYEGCEKHDPKARKRVKERMRNHSKKIIVQTPIDPKPLPTLSRLITMSRHPRETHSKRYGTVLRSLIESRGLSLSEIDRRVGWRIGRTQEMTKGKYSLFLGDAMAILDAIGKYDMEQKK